MTNVAWRVYAPTYVTAMRLADHVKFARIGFVLADVEVIPFVQETKLVSTNNAEVSVVI
jgi:hypothetical protein